MLILIRNYFARWDRSLRVPPMPCIFSRKSPVTHLNAGLPLATVPCRTRQVSTMWSLLYSNQLCISLVKGVASIVIETNFAGVKCKSRGGHVEKCTSACAVSPVAYCILYSVWLWMLRQCVLRYSSLNTHTQYTDCSHSHSRADNQLTYCYTYITCLL
jgi:hypothetical protein